MSSIPPKNSVAQPESVRRVRRSPLHQRRHMRGDRAREPLEIVATLQHQHDTLMGMLTRDLHELARRPGEVGLDQGLN